jgi:hypothetical protein
MDVLGELLGLSESDVAGLEERGVLSRPIVGQASPQEEGT